jgi:hypothetical protein
MITSEGDGEISSPGVSKSSGVEDDVDDSRLSTPEVERPAGPVDSVYCIQYRMSFVTKPLNCSYCQSV